MNLYCIQFTHYAPKDSESGILGYMVANNDEEVYEFIKSEPEIHENSRYNCYNCYKYWEEDDETFKDRIISCCGDMFDDESEVSDLYYGATQHGWELVYTDIPDEQIELLRKLKILVN